MEEVEPDMELDKDDDDSLTRLVKELVKPVEHSRVGKHSDQPGGDIENETNEDEPKVDDSVNEADDEKEKSAEMSKEVAENGSVNLLETQGSGGSTQFTQLDRAGFAQKLVEDSGSLGSGGSQKSSPGVEEIEITQDGVTEEEQEVLLASQKIKTQLEKGEMSSLPNPQDDS